MRKIQVASAATGSSSISSIVSVGLSASMIETATKNGTNSPSSTPNPASNSNRVSMSFVSRVITRPTATRS